MKSNVIKDKSFLFAVRVVNLCRYLNTEHREFVLSKQLVRSGTNIGAMVREAEQAESDKDFMHKLSIALKEINETIYWLELLKETNYLTFQQFESINNDTVELIKLLTSIIKTTKAKINNG